MLNLTINEQRCLECMGHVPGLPFCTRAYCAVRLHVTGLYLADEEHKALGLLAWSLPAQSTRLGCDG